MTKKNPHLIPRPFLLAPQGTVVCVSLAFDRSYNVDAACRLLTGDRLSLAAQVLADGFNICGHEAGARNLRERVRARTG